MVRKTFFSVLVTACLVFAVLADKEFMIEDPDQDGVQVVHFEQRQKSPSPFQPMMRADGVNADDNQDSTDEQQHQYLKSQYFHGQGQQNQRRTLEHYFLTFLSWMSPQEKNELRSLKQMGADRYQLVQHVAAIYEQMPQGERRNKATLLLKSACHQLNALVIGHQRAQSLRHSVDQGRRTSAEVQDIVEDMANQQSAYKQTLHQQYEPFCRMVASQPRPVHYRTSSWVPSSMNQQQQYNPLLRYLRDIPQYHYRLGNGINNMITGTRNSVIGASDQDQSGQQRQQQRRREIQHAIQQQLRQQHLRNAIQQIKQQQEMDNSNIDNNPQSMINQQQQYQQQIHIANNGAIGVGVQDQSGQQQQSVNSFNNKYNNGINMINNQRIQQQQLLNQLTNNQYKAAMQQQIQQQQNIGESSIDSDNIFPYSINNNNDNMNSITTGRNGIDDDNDEVYTHQQNQRNQMQQLTRQRDLQNRQVLQQALTIQNQQQQQQVAQGQQAEDSMQDVVEREQQMAQGTGSSEQGWQQALVRARQQRQRQHLQQQQLLSTLSSSSGTTEPEQQFVVVPDTLTAVTAQ